MDLVVISSLFPVQINKGKDPLPRDHDSHSKKNSQDIVFTNSITSLATSFQLGYLYDTGTASSPGLKISLQSETLSLYQIPPCQTNVYARLLVEPDITGLPLRAFVSHLKRKRSQHLRDQLVHFAQGYLCSRQRASSIAIHSELFGEDTHVLPNAGPCACSKLQHASIHCRGVALKPSIGPVHIGIWPKYRLVKVNHCRVQAYIVSGWDVFIAQL